MKKDTGLTIQYEDDKTSSMNVYEMYHKNNNEFGFLIKSNPWSGNIVKVTSIDGVIEGEKIKGKSPYFGNPKVMAEFYKCDRVCDCNSQNMVSVSEVSCASNFSSYDCLTTFRSKK